jgi:glycosyltransferase involved in cell wall biosynthesis
MRVLIFHGYLLRGTGSNVYNASLARALSGLGHEVHLLSQDRRAAELGWVDRVGGWEGGELRVRPAAGSSPGPGSITVYRPEIGGLLPVYVRDQYEGFAVKTFAELSDAELDRYIEANVAAVREVAEAAGAVDATLANHLVMGPAILARAGLRFAAGIHGSALEYTVKPEPDRFLPYAREGMEAAAGVLVGSRHTADSLWSALELAGLRERTRLGPPGVDAELFAPRPPGDAGERLRALAGSLRRSGQGAGGRAWGRDPLRAAAAIDQLSAARGPRIVLVGKLIVSKGVDLLLAAWPLIAAANPGARLIVVGFGEYEEGIVELWSAIERGELDRVREIAAAGRALEGGPAGPLRMLLSFLDRLPGGYLDASRAAAGSVSFAGRLEHDEVGRLVPACDVLVFPSTFPEAFGMVAAEAACAGVAPVSADHSGAAEVSRALAAELPEDAAAHLSFSLGDDAVLDLARSICGWLRLDPSLAADARRRLSAAARRLWSWEGVARSVLAASAGRLDELPRVPDE